LPDKTGLLFRSWNGGPFSRQAFVMKFTRLSGYVGRKVTAYSLRHSFASRALASGESDAIVAALLGHANTAMIHKHYSHLSEFGRQLREAAERIGKAS
jgi:integrase